MTIFGYNTDVKHADVIYHVQSEARQNDLLLQTLIYVKGQCVGKHTFSYAAQTLEPDFSEDAIHELLKAQHRSLVDELQAGRLGSALVLRGDIVDVGGAGLALQWSNPKEPSASARRRMRLRVLDDGQPAAGADIAVLSSVELSAMSAKANESGEAEIELNPAEMAESAVIVKASRGGKSATRKFRFRH